MKREYYQHDVKWLTLENESGTATLSQHAYVPYGDGNKALCCGAFAADTDETPLPHVRLSGEAMRGNCCRKCRVIFDKLLPFRLIVSPT